MKFLRTGLPNLDQAITTQRTALIVLVALTGLPLALVAVPWQLGLMLAAVLFGVWRVPHPNRWLKFLVLIGLMAALWWFRPANQQGFFSAAVLILTTLKLFELKTLRDGQFLLNTALFGLFCAALLSPTAWMTGLVFAGTAGLMLGHYLLLNPEAGFSWPRFKRLLLRTARVAMFALPVMIALFYVFPRVGGGLFSFGVFQGSVSGLTDRLEPGSLADLALSDTTRFRVLGQQADTDQYYRAYVLEQFDGQQWTRSDQTAYEPIGAGLAERTIRIEMPAHSQRWLPLPEWPVDTPPSGPGATLTATEDQTTLWQRDFVVSLSPRRTVALDSQDRARLSQMPALNPATEEWLQPLRGQPLSQALQALSKHYSENFFYSLQPPAAPPSAQVDHLMFDAQSGFCGHFANATAYVLRRLGFAARIVIGFQGGARNLVGDYIQIRDADAHAWVEVHDGQGWLRVDPTAWVAPSRLSLGLDGINQTVRSAAGINRYSIQLPSSQLQRDLWRTLREGMDWVQRGYTLWVVDFNRQRQQQLLSLLPKLWPLAVLGLGLIGLGLWRRRQRQDPWLRRYDRWAKRQGIPRAAWQTPGQSCDRPEVQAFNSAWLEWRYGEGVGADELNRTWLTLRRTRRH